MRRVTLALLLLLLTTSLAAEDAQVLFLGTFHFSNPGLDYVKSEVPDVLSDVRQKEIAQVVEKLAKFKPTRIVLEWPAEKDAELNKRYEAYRTGKAELGRDEIDQIGFRLAKQLGHTKVYATDVKGDMDLGAVMAYAQQHDPAFMALFGKAMTEVIQPKIRMQVEKPIGETLRHMNDPKQLERDHRLYLDMARVGGNGNYVGAEQFGIWYTRNVKIYANLARLAQPGERLLVIYGGGHLPILRQLAGETSGVKVVEANGYL
jgi:Family of unknown function (DUF5694)